MVISGIISNLSLTQINVINIKNFSNERGTDEYINEFNKFIKRIKIKFTIFFVLNFFLLFVFWYYLSLLKTKQLIIFTFCVKTDYNSRLIKISSFFLTFAIFYTVKALFFNDAVMHVIYKNAGE